MKSTLALLAVLAAAASALPATSVQEGANTKANAFWKGTPMDAMVGELQAGCARDDAVACVKFRVLSVLDQVMRKDSFQVSESMSVVRNSYEGAEDAAEAGRSEGGDLVDMATHYLQRHDVLVRLPWGARVAVSPRALDKEQLDIKLDFGADDADDDSSNQVDEARHRKGKGKLRKMMVPILVFILLKAMTLIPLAIGVLGLKAWNALQLSFFSFVIATGLAIFQLCKKIASDQAPVSQLSAHVGPWDAHYAAARAFEVPEAANVAADVAGAAAYPGDAHSLAYRGH